MRYPVVVGVIAFGLLNPDPAYAPTFQTVPEDRPSVLETAGETGLAIAVGAIGIKLGAGGQSVAAEDAPSLQSLAARVREAGLHPAAVSRRTIAIGENSAGELFAGSSNGFDRGQRTMAQLPGIECVPCKAGMHAEENLLREVPRLRRVGTSVRMPCGPGEHNCAAQLQQALVKVEK